MPTTADDQPLHGNACGLSADHKLHEGQAVVNKDRKQSGASRRRRRAQEPSGESKAPETDTTTATPPASAPGSEWDAWILSNWLSLASRGDLQDAIEAARDEVELDRIKLANAERDLGGGVVVAGDVVSARRWFDSSVGELTRLLAFRDGLGGAVPIAPLHLRAVRPFSRHTIARAYSIEMRLFGRPPFFQHLIDKFANAQARPHLGDYAADKIADQVRWIVLGAQEIDAAYQIVARAGGTPREPSYQSIVNCLYDIGNMQTPRVPPPGSADATVHAVVRYGESVLREVSKGAGQPAGPVPIAEQLANATIRSLADFDDGAEVTPKELWSRVQPGFPTLSQTLKGYRHFYEVLARVEARGWLRRGSGQRGWIVVKQSQSASSVSTTPH
jgi:hypothetical protein